MTNGIRTTVVNCLSKEPEMSKTRDMDFCLANEEEEFFEDINSPTDNSEDSVEVKVSAISPRNKRKCTEPRKVPEKFTGPLKKRMCLKLQSENLQKISNSSENNNSSAPFRPWSPKLKRHEVKKEIFTPDSVKTSVKVKLEPDNEQRILHQSGFIVPSVPLLIHGNGISYHQISEAPTSYFRPPSPLKYCYPEEPVALIKKCQKSVKSEPSSESSLLGGSSFVKSETTVPIRVPVHPTASTSSAEADFLIRSSTEVFPALKKQVEENQNQQSEISSCSSKREQRNYKNMTRERRIEANARERTRVHTISAAFDTLRKSIPSYSHNQKLSKLSVLRIACSYIMTLSNIVQDDDPSKVAEGVDLITKTIQREGKLRKKKDDND